MTCLAEVEKSLGVSTQLVAHCLVGADDVALLRSLKTDQDWCSRRSWLGFAEAGPKPGAWQSNHRPWLRKHCFPAC